MYKAYLKNENPTESTIRLRCLGRISDGFEFYSIDQRLLTRDELNIYAIYCLDIKEVLVLFDGVMKYIKNDLISNKIIPREYTAEELVKELKSSLQEVRICLRLITHNSKYYDPFVYKENGFGIPSILIKSDDVFKSYLRYQSVERFIEEMFEYFYQNSYIQDDFGINIPDDWLVVDEPEYDDLLAPPMKKAGYASVVFPNWIYIL